VNDELFRLDLEQVERVRRLSARVTHGLKLYDQYTEAVAIQESMRDAIRAGIQQPQGGDPVDPEATIERLRDDQVKVLMTLKAAVWDGSEAIRRTHLEARRLLAEQKDKKED